MAAEFMRVVACPRKGLGDIGAETYCRAGQPQRAPGRAGAAHQIQRRMLAMTAIWASQPAANANVRTPGMPAE